MSVPGIYRLMRARGLLLTSATAVLASACFGEGPERYDVLCGGIGVIHLAHGETATDILSAFTRKVSVIAVKEGARLVPSGESKDAPNLDIADRTVRFTSTAVDGPTREEVFNLAATAIVEEEHTMLFFLFTAYETREVEVICKIIVTHTAAAQPPPFVEIGGVRVILRTTGLAIMGQPLEVGLELTRPDGSPAQGQGFATITPQGLPPGHPNAAHGDAPIGPDGKVTIQLVPRVSGPHDLYTSFNRQVARFDVVVEVAAP